MSLQACVLASGSSGNALLVRGPEGVLLVDAGLGLKDLGRRLAQVECDPDELCGVLVTHEHSDHAAGAFAIARRLNLPIRLSRGTAEGSERYCRGGERLELTQGGESFSLAGIEVQAWSCPHDSREPLQFGFRVGEAAMALCTDLGEITPAVADRLDDRQLLILEFNHDRTRLQTGPYPWFLKKRILGPRGHLSNEQGAALLERVCGSALKRVVLAHLSRENNLPELAHGAAGEALARAGRGDLPVQVAEPNRPGEWLDVFSGCIC